MYRVIETKVFGAILYGIEGQGIRAECLSRDRRAVAALAALCREADLDPIHLGDVAADWFS